MDASRKVASQVRLCVGHNEYKWGFYNCNTSICCNSSLSEGKVIPFGRSLHVYLVS